MTRSGLNQFIYCKLGPKHRWLSSFTSKPERGFIAVETNFSKSILPIPPARPLFHTLLVKMNSKYTYNTSNTGSIELQYQIIRVPKNAQPIPDRLVSKIDGTPTALASQRPHASPTCHKSIKRKKSYWFGNVIHLCSHTRWFQKMSTSFNFSILDVSWQLYLLNLANQS